MTQDTPAASHMRAEVRLRRRARPEEDISALSTRHVEAFSKVSGFWAPGKGPADARLEAGKQLGVHLDFDCLADWMDGQLSYKARFPGWTAPDDASEDDSLSLNCADFSSTEYADFCTAILPWLIEVFAPYWAVVETNQEVRLADWDHVGEEFRRTGRSLDGRDAVYRVWPVSYWDEELCRRAFGMSAEEVVARAGPECEQAYVLAGGAFLLVDSKVVSDPADLDALDTRIKARLA